MSVRPGRITAVVQGPGRHRAPGRRAAAGADRATSGTASWTWPRSGRGTSRRCWTGRCRRIWSRTRRPRASNCCRASATWSPSATASAWDHCAHTAALCYQVARLLDQDPFVLLLMRGRGERQLLDALQVRSAARADAVRGSGRGGAGGSWAAEAYRGGGHPAAAAGRAAAARRSPGCRRRWTRRRRPPHGIDPARPGVPRRGRGRARPTGCWRRRCASRTAVGDCPDPVLTAAPGRGTAGRDGPERASGGGGGPARGGSGAAGSVPASNSPYVPGGSAGPPAWPCWRRSGPRSGGRSHARVPHSRRPGRRANGPRCGPRATAGRWPARRRQLRLGRDGRWWPYRKERGRWVPAGTAAQDPATALASASGRTGGGANFEGAEGEGDRADPSPSRSLQRSRSAAAPADRRPRDGNRDSRSLGNLARQPAGNRDGRSLGQPAGHAKVRQRSVHDRAGGRERRAGEQPLPRGDRRQAGDVPASSSRSRPTSRTSPSRAPAAAARTRRSSTTTRPARPSPAAAPTAPAAAPPSPSRPTTSRPAT